MIHPEPIGKLRIFSVAPDATNKFYAKNGLNEETSFPVCLFFLSPGGRKEESPWERGCKGSSDVISYCCH